MSTGADRYAMLAVGRRVAPHIPHIGGWRVFKAAPAYSEPMNDRLAVSLEDPESPTRLSYCCVLKWPGDFEQPRGKPKLSLRNREPVQEAPAKKRFTYTLKKRN